METRAARTPLSIKIAIGFFVLGLTLQLLRATSDAINGAMNVTGLVGVAIDIAAITFQLVALPRLSRWAPICQSALTVIFLGIRYLNDPNWTDAYPMLGPFIMIIPLAIYLALVLPHWRKMNWAPLGLRYKPAEAPADIF